ncbi:MAG: (2Fe-2S) ferredoxin domain-containing protein [Spirulinaceae cyanobacterium]
MTDPQPRRVLVCQNCTCLSRDSEAVLDAFYASDLPPDVVVEATGCHGQCNLGPSVRILPDETWYVRLTPEDVPRIVQEHLNDGQPVADKLHPRIHGYAQYY